MTFRFHHSFLALAAAIAMTGLQAAAFAGEAPATATRTIEVPTADLNLASPEGQAALDRRIAVAARRVCQTAEAHSSRTGSRRRACEEAALASALPQRDRLVARAEARNGQLTSRVILTPGIN